MVKLGKEYMGNMYSLILIYGLVLIFFGIGFGTLIYMVIKNNKNKK